LLVIGAIWLRRMSLNCRWTPYPSAKSRPPWI
jgi:hypothetical protein